MNCPDGYIVRKAYTRKGKKYAKTCIRKTSPYLQRSENFQNSERKRMTLRLKGFRKTMRKNNIKCAKGTILRKSYVRIVKKTGTIVKVPAGCIKDLGLPGKREAPGIGILRKGELKHFGYVSIKNMSIEKRHMALSKAVKTLGSLTVWKKLNAIYVYTKNTNPILSNKYKSDRDWIKLTFDIKAF